MSYVNEATTLPDYKPSKGKEGFAKDLSRAHFIENQLTECLLKQDDIKEVNNAQHLGSFSDWDLEAVFEDDTTTTIEVKEDKMAPVTKNVAIELGRVSYGVKRDTCLSISKSDAYAYYIEDRFYILKTSVLKDLVESCKYNKTWGGDRGAAFICLIPLKIIVENANCIIKP